MKQAMIGRTMVHRRRRRISGTGVAKGVALLAVACAVAVAALAAGGGDPLWRLAAGPPDLGPASFERLARRDVPNDALACPADLCRAASDLAPPVFAVPARDLRRAFARAIADEPRLERVAADDAALADRYVQRSRIMRFPDTVDVRFLDLPGGRSTLALYSRSQLGSDDFGVNRARIARWLALLSAAAPAAR
ncbi:hypothetical protein STVA_15040 [Allostella vacuolata]|nr:hypothetical protein STVA_15040 [Stella vacuolata]